MEFVRSISRDNRFFLSEKLFFGLGDGLGKCESRESFSLRKKYRFPVRNITVLSNSFIDTD